jgi:hypothetical protein
MAGQRIKAMTVCARKVRRLSGSEKAPSGRQFGSKNETYPSAVGEPTYFSVNRINRRRGAHFWPRHGARQRRVSHNSSVPCCCNNLAYRRTASTLRGLFAGGSAYTMRGSLSLVMVIRCRDGAAVRTCRPRTCRILPEGSSSTSGGGPRYMGSKSRHRTGVAVPFSSGIRRLNRARQCGSHL